MPLTLYTVGHSTRSADELVGLLRDAGVRSVADVRRFPASRRHPQHARAALEASLGAAGIAYAWLGEALGGRRRARVAVEQSENRGLRVAAFRHYADDMTTPAFEAGVAALEALCAGAPTAVLCAERLWWRCHRRLIADLLVARGHRVLHLIDSAQPKAHALAELAVAKDGRVAYPGLL